MLDVVVGLIVEVGAVVDRNPESQRDASLTRLRVVESCNQTRTKPSEASVITQPRANHLSMKNQ